MKELKHLQESTQKNCDLVDAENAQNYGLCVYLLKMREYYRWRNGISLTADVENADIHEWIADQEEYWDSIQGDGFEKIMLGEQAFSPFETNQINKILIPNQLVYSGGLAYGNIPLFFLAELEKQEERQGYSILISSKELSRGLFGPPALIQDDVIFIRKEALRDWLWARYEEWDFTRRDNVAKKAFGYYDFENNPEQALDEITRHEMETLILHEIGEGQLGSELGGKWKEMLIEFAYSRTEIILRAVKDISVDTRVMLPALIEEKRDASLHLYFSFYADMRKELCPGLLEAYHRWSQSGDYSVLMDEVKTTEMTWLVMCKKAMEIYHEKGKAGNKDIDLFFGVTDYDLGTSVN